MRRKIATLAVLVIAILATGGVLAARYELQRSAAPPPAPIPTVPVVAGVVSSQDVPIYLRGVGTVIAYNTVLVRSQIQPRSPSPKGRPCMRMTCSHKSIRGPIRRRSIR